MAKACVPCLSPRVKELLSSSLGSDYPSLRPLLAGVADCPEGKLLNLCPAGPGGARTKRAPSAYNLFIKACIQRRPSGQPVPETMKKCAAEYKMGKR